jgi:AcrR family transcriptional regulator
MRVLAETPGAPPARPLRRSDDVHEAILKAADELLAESGYLNVSIEAIAARAGAGKQTIYRWWPSKADLYMELYTVLANRVMTVPDTGTLVEDLRQIYRGLLTLFRATGGGPALAGLIAEAQSNPAFAKRLFDELVTRRRAVWVEMLERARARGELPANSDLNLAVDILSGPVWYRLLLGHAPLDDSLADSLVRTLLGGLLHPLDTRSPGTM